MKFNLNISVNVYWLK